DFIVTGVETLQPLRRGGCLTVIDLFGGLKLSTYLLESGQERAVVLSFEDGVKSLHIAKKQAFELMQLDIRDKARVCNVCCQALFKVHDLLVRVTKVLCLRKAREISRQFI